MDPLNENVVAILQESSNDFIKGIWKDGAFWDRFLGHLGSFFGTFGVVFVGEGGFGGLFLRGRWVWRSFFRGKGGFGVFLG